MSFSVDVKEDVSRLHSNTPCCRKAELAAFLRLSNCVRFCEGEVSLLWQTEHSVLARKIFTLIKDSGFATELAIQRKAPIKKKPLLTLNVPPQKNLAAFLADLGLTDEGGGWQGFAASATAKLAKSDCCKRAYLRGAFLAAGYINCPEGAYHMEISLPDMRFAIFLQKILAGFDIAAKQTRRKGLILLYLKEADQISLFLNIIGSHRCLLKLESLRVKKDLINQVNRKVNCDNANVEKTVTASLKQVERLRLIEKGPGLSSLKPALEEVALLRLQNPDAPLSELSAISGIGRSAINHRLRSLLEIADEIERKKGAGISIELRK